MCGLGTAKGTWIVCLKLGERILMTREMRKWEVHWQTASP